MAKRTISFGDYEEPTWEEYTGPPPPPNQWFTASCTRVKYLEDDDQLLFIFEITEGDFKGWGKGWYAPFEGDLKWKMHQVLRALQGGLTKDVTVDWENEKQVTAWLAKQKPVRIKTREYNDNISINKVSPLLEAVGTPKASAATEPELDQEEGPEEDYTSEELADMSVEDLEEILTEEFEFGEEDMPEKARGRGAAAKYKAALVEAILEEQAGGDDNQDAVEEAAAEEEDEEFDDGFEDEEEADEEPEPEPVAAKTRRRAGGAPVVRKTAAKAAAPAKATPPTRRRR
jgi:hypothetical protein